MIKQRPFITLFFWGEKIPTIRSLFSFEQFEEVLQKLAHQLAVEAVKRLNQGDVRIQIHGKRFSTLETGHVTIRFFVSHASYFEQPNLSHKTWWGFDVEEKLFQTSNHSTKISFVAGQTDAETAVKRKKVEEFIDKIMAEASMKPVPRFTLKNRIG